MHLHRHEGHQGTLRFFIKALGKTGSWDVKEAGNVATGPRQKHEKD